MWMYIIIIVILLIFLYFIINYGKKDIDKLVSEGNITEATAIAEDDLEVFEAYIKQKKT